MHINTHEDLHTHSGGKDDDLPPGAHIPWIANYLREHNPNKYVTVVYAVLVVGALV
jgi:hypothetical protein